MSTIANMRAAWMLVSPLLTASWRLISHSVSLRSCHHRAASVWSAVRVVLLTAPMAFTSLYSRAYCALVSAGGPEVVKEELRGIRNGLTSMVHAPSEPNVGGVGRHWPGVVPTFQVRGPKAPSLVRATIIAAAV